MKNVKKGPEKELVLRHIIDGGPKAINEFDDSSEVHLPAIHNKLISIRLPINMLRQLRAIAVSKGDIGYQQVIKTYIAQGISDDCEMLMQKPSVAHGGTSSTTYVLNRFEYPAVA